MAAPISIDIEIGNDEKSFFGLKLEPGIKYNLSIKANVCLANVALDPSTVEKLPSSEEKCDEEFGEECEAGTDYLRLRIIVDGQDVTLTHFNKKHLQSHAGFCLLAGDEVTLYAKGNGTCYLFGYKQLDYSSD